MNGKKYPCPLCQSDGESFYDERFRRCPECLGIFRCNEYFLSPEEEQSRYEEHNNDVTDIRYQEFVDPIVSSIRKNHTSKELGLDFGCGTGPVISHLLGQEGFQTQLYDPFFYNIPELLEREYDFVVACEVVEHFHDPKKEFELLYNLLREGGRLYIMTGLYTPQIDFGKWYYKNDPTHVFFYSAETFKWIEKYWSWKKYSRMERCIVLEK